MELTGRISAVMPAQSGVSARTGNNWMSQDYVIEVPGQYPRKCLFSKVKISRCSLISTPMSSMAVAIMISAHITLSVASSQWLVLL